MGNENRFKYDLFEITSIKKFLSLRFIQLIFSVLGLIILGIVIFAGFFGTPLGSANFATIFVWLVWFTLLLSFLIPLFGRIWCSICPIPIVGELFQRGRLYSDPKEDDKNLGLNKKVPKRFRNLWLSNIMFLVFAAVVGLLTVNPRFTSIILLLFVIASTIFAVIYRNRAFCRYVCPIGGFIGLYSLASPLELRVKDQELCRTHKVKDCYLGNESGYGCPWFEYPGNMIRNINCGLCFECVRTCPYDNISLNLRPFGADLYLKDSKMDEAFRAIIMTGASVLYLLTYFGPYAILRNIANISSLFGFLKYFVLLIFLLVFIFGLFTYLPSWISSRMDNNEVSTDNIFISYSYSLIPVGLTTWIGFSFQILSSNWKYIIDVINDPFGWNWNLLRIGNIDRTIKLEFSVLIIFLILIMIGFIWSLYTLSRIFQKIFPEKDKFNLYYSIHALFLLIYTMLLIYVVAG